MQNIDWCEGGLQLTDFATNDFGENELNPGIKYIMLRLKKLIEKTFTRGVIGYRIVCRNKSSI